MTEQNKHVSYGFCHRYARMPTMAQSDTTWFPTDFLQNFVEFGILSVAKRTLWYAIQ